MLLYFLRQAQKLAVLMPCLRNRWANGMPAICGPVTELHRPDLRAAGRNAALPWAVVEALLRDEVPEIEVRPLRDGCADEVVGMRHGLQGRPGDRAQKEGGRETVNRGRLRHV